MRLILALATVLSLPLAAQEECGAVRIDSIGGSGSVRTIRPGVVHRFGSGRVAAQCVGQFAKMDTDSIALRSDLFRADMTGNVIFEDSSIILSSERATYDWSEERLDAFDNVRLFNKENGSVLTGSVLTYWRESPGVRDSAELRADRRPTVTYRTSLDDTGGWTIVSDRLRMIGSSLAWAGGRVVITQEDFTATSDSAQLDSSTGEGELVGRVLVSGSGDNPFRLHGQSVAYRTGGSELEWVQSRHEARAESEEWLMVADTIEFDVLEGEVQAGRGWGDSTATVATSDDYRMEADSIEIESPAQLLEGIKGFGTAIATSLTSDDLEERDWIAGDSIQAVFGEFPGGRGIQEILSNGNARAFYKIPSETGGAPSINYSRGLEIRVTFTEEAVDIVRVIGEADGVHLEPARRQSSAREEDGR